MVIMGKHHEPSEPTLESGIPERRGRARSNRGARHCRRSNREERCPSPGSYRQHPPERAGWRERQVGVVRRMVPRRERSRCCGREGIPASCGRRPLERGRSDIPVAAIESIVGCDTLGGSGPRTGEVPGQTYHRGRRRRRVDRCRRMLDQRMDPLTKALRMMEPGWTSSRLGKRCQWPVAWIERSPWLYPSSPTWT